MVRLPELDLDPVAPCRRATELLHVRKRRAAVGLGLARSEKLPPQALEFQLLFGIGRSEQLRLAAAGYRFRVLISYGVYWFAWYMRRLAERPANVLFVLKSLVAR